MKFLRNSVVVLFIFSIAACQQKQKENSQRNTTVVKGLYSYGPEIRSFTDCGEGREYWVIDSAKTLELAYSKLNFEKPYEPVYIEVECNIVKSDSLTVAADFDSTMVVTKLIKLTKDIPDGPCN